MKAYLHKGVSKWVKMQNVQLRTPSKVGIGGLQKYSRLNVSFSQSWVSTQEDGLMNGIIELCKDGT